MDLGANMIIVRISGGIGNQLFQYAMGRALTLKNGQELKLDTTFYEMGIEKDRYFKLNDFNITQNIATPEDFKKIGVPNPKNNSLPARLVRKFCRDLGPYLPLNRRRMIIETTFNFRPEIFNIKKDCYLSGVWQSERYFVEYADQIRQDFQLSVPLSAEAEALKRDITQVNAISLHVRRGDQVHNPHLLQKHGALGGEYYKNAVNHMISKTTLPHLFIFSDEIEWCKENLKFNIPTVYVAGKNLKDYEEMALMSWCKHNIIAKSSFSWWGAWLNANPKKIIVAPAQRFGSDTQTAPDLYPDSWIKI
ncbi:MAG: alpha-1,2-fucosyltransferase [bacterium]|nr:alpha-1,2-fucosyltransferase [bacterium]